MTHWHSRKLLWLSFVLALMALKLCFVLKINIIYTLRQNKSLYLQHLIDRNVIFLADLQNDKAQILKYEEFLQSKIFISEYQSVINAIPGGVQ